MSISRSRKSGFTLIELLVVIAIIAILAAILFPVFAKAREKARQTACLSNAKQIGMSLMMYISDYEDTFPLAMQCTGGDGPGADSSQWAGIASIFDVLMPYSKSEKLWDCPSTPESAITKVTTTSASYLAGVSLPNDYCVNADLMPPLGGWYSVNRNYAPGAMSLSSIANPAGTIAMFDCRKQGIYLNYAGWMWWRYGWAFGTYGSIGDIAAIHNDGANYTFADGHAKWMKPGPLNSDWSAFNVSQSGQVSKAMFTPAED